MIETRSHMIAIGKRVRRALCTCLAATASVVCMSLPQLALGQATINPYASVQAERDSNVFRVENAAIATQFYGDPTLADTDFRYIAGVEGTYLWSLQKLTATFEGREIEYDHFKFLDHSEYLGNVQLNWKLSNVLDGVVQVRQEHLAAYFADSNSPYLEVDTDRNIVAKVNLIIRTDWKLEAGANSRTYDGPLQYFPDFVERDTGTHLGVSYLGIADFTYGFGVDHIDGVYHVGAGLDSQIAPSVGPYSQTSEYLRMNYVINGLQTVSGALGYTKRDQTDEPSLSAVTGQFKYLRQLTGKTSVSVQFVRAINSYIASGGSEIDTTGTLGAQWQATYKVAVNLAYSFQTSSYVGQIIPGSTATGRTDHLPSESLNVVYQPLKRIQIKAYISAQSRRSNEDFDRFHDTTAGIQATAHWR